MKTSKLTVTIYDSCPQFKAIFSDGQVITDKDMGFRELCNNIDILEIDKGNVVVYNRFMNRVYL